MRVIDKEVQHEDMAIYWWCFRGRGGLWGRWSRSRMYSRARARDRARDWNWGRRRATFAVSGRTIWRVIVAIFIAPRVRN